MRAVFVAAAAVVLVGLIGHAWGRADVTTTVSTTSPPMELVVFEHPDCTYCPLFRARIADPYRHSPHAAGAPLRFVDITSTDTGDLALKEPIRMVPTAVVAKNGREVDRIAGLWSPDNFFKMVTAILRSAE